jgi:hypothetical protein
MQKITRNTFEKGLNTDQEVSKIQPQQYTDAQNVELIGDGDFFSLKNIKGTTKLDNITQASNSSVIGVFENTYDIGGQKKKCLTIFTLEDVIGVQGDSGTFVLTGNPVTFARAGNKLIAADKGLFNITGLDTNECVEIPGSPAYQQCIGSTLYQFRYNCDGTVYQAESLGPCV